MVIRTDCTDADHPSSTIVPAKERLRVAVEGVDVRRKLQM